jgi:AcrR family transcriptional regulator
VFIPNDLVTSAAMPAPEAVNPNRRGLRSRELVLDAAENLMAESGFEAATLERIVKAAGIPPSSVYHYFGSKDGVLLAVMERGARRFFDDLPESAVRLGSPLEHLAAVIGAAARTLGRHGEFMRLMVVFAVQPPTTARDQIEEVVRRVREMALARLRSELALAFDDDRTSAVTERLARFALTAIDGAFVASQADGEVVERLLQPLPEAIAAARTRLRAAGAV